MSSPYQNMVVGYVQVIHFALPTSRARITAITNWANYRFYVQPLYADEPDSSYAIPQTEILSYLASASGDYDTDWHATSGSPPDSHWFDWWALYGLTPPVPVLGPTTGLPATIDTVRMMTGVRVINFSFFGAEYDVAPVQLTVESVNPDGHTLTPINQFYYIDPDGAIWRASWTPPSGQIIATPGTVLLSDIVLRVSKRGGLVAAELNAVDLATIDVLGYPIARQANATDCLGPVLAAYFAYGSEYDGRVNFHFYGANTVMEVQRADLIEANGANQDAIIRNPRNQATEYPRRIVAIYVDPAQNYTPVNVAAARSSINVVAIGDVQFPIPVTMDANVAVQAADKALKVAYATLQGTEEYSLAFGGSSTYLKLCAGDPIAFQGRRYVVDEIVISNGYVKLTTRYDRQSAYTSTVQAIVGNPPPSPGSKYSGPTNLMAMNLPPLRPQDTYGIYLAASSLFGSTAWRGCVVQVSYDGKVSWQTATQILLSSTMGVIPAGTTTPLTVAVNADLNSVTDAQIAANANAYALVDQFSQNAEVGQFKTATETTPDTFQLTNIARGLGGTPINANTPGDQFTMLDAVYFVPIDLTFAGRRLYFRAIGFGENAADAGIISLIYRPSFRRILGFETANTGENATTSDGYYIEAIGS